MLFVLSRFRSLIYHSAQLSSVQFSSVRVYPFVLFQKGFMNIQKKKKEDEKEEVIKHEHEHK
jgi:hypothetical protein